MKTLCRLALAASSLATVLSACDEYESTVCDIEYRSTFVSPDGYATGNTFSDPQSGLQLKAKAHTGTERETGVGQKAATKKVDEINQSQSPAQLAAAERQWRIDFAKWQQVHGENFKKYAQTRREFLDNPGLIVGGRDESSAGADPTTFADTFSYPPPQKPVRTTASLSSCRQLNVNQAFNSNMFRGMDRGLNPQGGESAAADLRSFWDFVVDPAFAAVGGNKEITIKPEFLTDLAQLDPSFAPSLKKIRSVKARRAGEYGDRVWQLALERSNGLRIAFYVDQDAARACELLNKVVERKPGSASWALARSGGKNGMKVKHPFDGAACSPEKLASAFDFANLDRERHPGAPAITLLISKTDKQLDFFIPNYDFDSGRESQLSANFRAFFGR